VEKTGEPVESLTAVEPVVHLSLELSLDEELPLVVDLALRLRLHEPLPCF
jgi:hypothetical protein